MSPNNAHFKSGQEEVVASGRNKGSSLKVVPCDHQLLVDLPFLHSPDFVIPESPLQCGEEDRRSVTFFDYS